MFQKVFQLTDRRKSLGYPVPLQLFQSFTSPPGIQVGLQWLWFLWSIFSKQAFGLSLFLRAKQRGKHSHNSLQAPVPNAQQKLVKRFLRWQRENPGGSRRYLLFCAWNTREFPAMEEETTGSCRCSQQLPDVASSISLQQHRQSLLAAVSQRPRWL